MDPLSIVAAAVSIAGTALNISITLGTFISGAKKVDQSINQLYSAVKGLENLLKNLGTTVKNPAIQAETASRNIHTGLLQYISQSLDVCKHTLDELYIELKDFDPSRRKSGKFKKPILQFKLNCPRAKSTALFEPIPSTIKH